MIKLRNLIKLTLLGTFAAGMSQGAHAAGPAWGPGSSAGPWGPRMAPPSMLSAPARIAAPPPWLRQGPPLAWRGNISRPKSLDYQIPARGPAPAARYRPIAPRPPMMARAPGMPMAIPGPYPVIPMMAQAPRSLPHPPVMAQAPWNRPRPRMMAQAPRSLPRPPMMAQPWNRPRPPMMAQAPWGIQQPRPWGKRLKAVRPMMPAPMTAWAPSTQWPAPARAGTYRPLVAQTPWLRKATPWQGKTTAYRPDEQAAQIAHGAELAPPPGPYASARDTGKATDTSAREGGRTDIEFQAAFGAAEPETAPVILPGAPG